MRRATLKELITVDVIREANARLIARTPSSNRFQRLTGRRFRLTREEIERAGVIAMRSLRRADTK
ncbi:MAG TPA: hypothetical protein VJ724_02755 [Tahibacter sp.]|nr:hypothetical protein [Tahibacter sp.]